MSLQYYLNMFFFKIQFKFRSIFDRINSTGLVYLRNIFLVFLIDMLVTDDEPLWEPLEWSLVQGWLLFIFLFSWIAETIISSQYGSFTGRDKRVYAGLLNTYWYVEAWFAFNLFITAIFISVPFYYEVTYTLSSVVAWWEWYDSEFFNQTLMLFFFIYIMLKTTLLGLRWLNWKKIFFISLLITFLIAHLLYMQFIITFFAYFTDIVWYNKTAWCDYNTLSQGPAKWSWGPSNRDHFTYKKTPAAFWFKNDALYASIIFFINIFVFFSLLFLFLQMLFFIRRVYTTKKITYTFLSYISSSLVQYYHSILTLYIFTFTCYVYQLLRLPTDLYFFDKVILIFDSIIQNIVQYPNLLLTIF